MSTQSNTSSQAVRPAGEPFRPANTFSKVNSAKLTTENRVWIHPVCAGRDDQYEPLKGWLFIGWNIAPFGPGTPERKHAIVYEKTSPAGSETIYASSHADWEPGIYWGHGNAARMKFPAQS